LLSNGEATERDYHLIVAADGMNSTLRQQYGGHRRLQRLTGTNALFDSESASSAVRSWDDSDWQAQANVVEDRKYTVFRGNANLTVKETGMNGVGFQTWGVGKSMRFATVPLSFPSGESKRTEKQVWFITTSDDSIAEEPDAIKRREMLLAAFADWHDPIPRMVEATPPDEISFERAKAHRHSVPPVLNINQVLTSAKKRQPTASGPGPAMVFVGDSFMTVDPILAQGFTMAMEGASQLAQAVEKGCQSSTDGNLSLAFDPDTLRKELMDRYETRYDRLLCLLRATELVQALGQPQGGFSGFVSKNIVRPLMRFSPDFIKRPFFNAMLKYSLGVPIRKSKQ
jgi:2-polyprenyl-6-methoxyphenol hydroxylase-like FAD-dependent oxidoreductase